VLPGFLETKMTAEVDSDVVEGARKANALGRFNTVEEVAEFIAYLHGMENVSGQIFQLDSRVVKWS
jgi:3-oxoacyl-[acyl-carrier protein] reductase